MTKSSNTKITKTSEINLFHFFLLFFLSIKGYFLIYVNPLPDEAYYWLWSKNIALSYFDHPPLSSWVQAIFFSSSSYRYILIRVLPILSLLIVITIMISWQRYLHRKLDYLTSLKSIVLFLAFPIYTIFFSISFPDYLLIALLFSSSFFLFLYFERNKNESKGIYYWYLAVLMFSLALLTKYNAILLGIGVLTYILYHKKNLGGPSYSHIAVSIIIIFLFQMPVLIWNLDNDFVSFSFHLGERLDEGKNLQTVFKNATGFLLGVLFAFSPVFMFHLKGNFFSENYSNNKINYNTMSKFVLLFSVTFCIFLSFFTNVLYYWLTPATVLFIPFLLDIIRLKIWQYLHILYGIFISLILVINMSIYPISAFFGDVDRETAIVFGWKKIVDIIGKEKKLYATEKVIFSDYRLGSLYIFHSNDFEVDVIMEKRSTQFDIWRDKENNNIMNSLIVTDQDFPLGQKMLSNFKYIQFLNDIEIHIGNNVVKKYQVFLGTKI